MSNLITISPWLYLSMSGDYPIEDIDPILGVERLREFGKSWAGETDIWDYKLSHLFGDFSNLADYLTFVGTHEIFYWDMVKIENAEIVVGKNMNHVYVLFPIPEAREALELIKKEIMK